MLQCAMRNDLLEYIIKVMINHIKADSSIDILLENIHINVQFLTEKQK